MKKEHFVDILHELIVVDTDENFVVSSDRDEDSITVHLNDNTHFVVSVKEI